MRSAIPVFAALAGAATAFILFLLFVLFSARHIFGEETIAGSPGNGAGIAFIGLFIGALVGCFVGLGIGSLTYAPLSRSKVSK
jgi:hypothetical protein